MDAVQTEPAVDAVRTEPAVDAVRTEPAVDVVQAEPAMDVVQAEPAMDVVQAEPAMDVVQAEPKIDVIPAMDVAQAGHDVDTKMTENTPVTETSEKIGGGVDSRFRKRSKYLSYPYTNSGLRQKDLPDEKEESKTPCIILKADASSKTSNSSKGSTSSAKLGSKRFRNNWYKKFISCSNTSSSPKFINASPSDLLSGLHSIAVDCMSPIEDKSFGLVEWFFCKHRISEFHDEAKLATSLIDENGGKTSKPVGNDLLDTKSEKKRKYTKTENAARRKMKSLSGLSDMKTSVSTGDCTSSGIKLKQKRKVEEVTSLHQPQNVETTMNENGNKCSSIPETWHNHNFLASAKKMTPRKKQKLEAAQEHQGAQFASHVDAKSTKCSSLVIDLQLVSPPLPVDKHEKSNGENKVTRSNLLVSTASQAGAASHGELVGNIPNHNLLVNAASELRSFTLEGYVGNITNHNMLGDTTTNVGTVSINKTGGNNRNKKAPTKHPNTQHAEEIPDLNNINFESTTTIKESDTVNFLSSESKLEHPRSLSSSSRHAKTVNFDRVEDNGESPGTFLFLQFAPGVDIPSKNDLLKIFCRFGPLRATETQSMKDNGSAQIVFVRNTDAAEAYGNLQQNNPFGPTLLGYRLHHPPAAAPPLEQFMTPPQPARSMSMPMPMPGEANPPLQFIKKNLQMMTSMLEKSGNNLSPHMRAKLDTEIKNLLKKVNSKGI